MRKADAKRVRIAAGVFLVWLVAGYVYLLRTDWIYLWHVPLYALCALFLWKPHWLRPRGMVRPKSAHFVLTAMAWSLWVARPLASLLHGDLHPDLLINSLFWIGGTLALAGTWAWLLHRYAWSTAAIFVASAFLTLTEPGYVLIRMAGANMWEPLFMTSPVLIAAHATLVAPVANAYRESWVHSETAPPGIGGIALGAVLTAVAFTLGNLTWFFLLRWMLVKT